MQLKRLCEENKHLFEGAIALYESAFPVEERRPKKEQERVMKKEAYHFDLIMDGDEFLGVMLYWETDTFIFLEHFTTLQSLRGRGYGSKALDLLKAKGKTVILEIEDPVDELTTRRFEFYKRNGFSMTPHYHIQAKYDLGLEDLMLKILSYPTVITTEEYLCFQDYMTKEIGILPNFNKEIIIRPMQDTDDKAQIAKLIYLSDKYIYPSWFDSLEDGQKVLSEMMELPTLYNKNNITVAVTADGFIAGTVVSKACPVNEEESHLYEAFARAGVPCDERTHNIFLDYYAKMDDTQGYYLANIAVDPACRGKGIAATLISQVIEGKPFCLLECVKANIGAWRLYQRLGFTIEFEYPGVFDVPCYRMTKKEN